MPRHSAAMTRRERIVATLTERINAGALRTGERLGSESAIAAEFGVSRGTVRQALAELQRRDLIATRAGLGSFVTFDGRPLDAHAGWTAALTGTGADVETELLDLRLVPADDAAAPTSGRATTAPSAGAQPPADPAPELPAELRGRDVVVLDRRRLLGGRPISYERATVPATGTLRDLPSTGLVDGSLTATLRAAGLVAHHGTQDARALPTSPDVAAHLAHAPGTVVLRTTRLSFTAAGDVVEHVVSYLDPAHFSLHLTFGETPA